MRAQQCITRLLCELFVIMIMVVCREPHELAERLHARLIALEDAMHISRGVRRSGISFL